VTETADWTIGVSLPFVRRDGSRRGSSSASAAAIPHRSFSSAGFVERFLKSRVKRRERARSLDRRSTSIQASDEIELTEVPPPMRPTLKVVLGCDGTLRSARCAMARPSA
jgi:hypothetical protein